MKKRIKRVASCEMFMMIGITRDDVGVFETTFKTPLPRFLFGYLGPSEWGSVKLVVRHSVFEVGKRRKIVHRFRAVSAKMLWANKWTEQDYLESREEELPHEVARELLEVFKPTLRLMVASVKKFKEHNDGSERQPDAQPDAQAAQDSEEEGQASSEAPL